MSKTYGSLIANLNKVAMEQSAQQRFAELKPQLNSLAQLIHHDLQQNTDDHQLPQYYAILLAQFKLILQICDQHPNLTHQLLNTFINYLTYLIALIENNKIVSEQYKVDQRSQSQIVHQQLAQYDQFSETDIEKRLAQHDGQIIGKIKQTLTNEQQGIKFNLFMGDHKLGKALDNLIKSYQEIDLTNHIYFNKLNELAQHAKNSEEFAQGIYHLFKDTTDLYVQLLKDGDDNYISKLCEYYIDDDSGGNAGTAANAQLTKNTVTRLYHIINDPDFNNDLSKLYEKFSNFGVTEQLICDIVESRDKVQSYRNHVRHNSIGRLRKVSNEVYAAMGLQHWRIDNENEKFTLCKDGNIYFTEKEQRLNKIREWADRIATPFSQIGGINEGIVPAFSWIKILFPLWLVAGPILGTILAFITFIAAYRCNKYTFSQTISQTIMKFFDGSLFLEKDGKTPMSDPKKYVIAAAAVFFGFAVTTVAYYFIGAYALAGIIATFGFKVGVGLLLCCSPFALITAPLLGTLLFISIFRYLSQFDWDVKKIWSNIKCSWNNFCFSAWDKVDKTGKFIIFCNKLGRILKSIFTLLLTGLIVFSTWCLILAVMIPFGIAGIAAKLIAGFFCVSAALLGLSKTDFMLSKLTVNNITKFPLQLLVFLPACLCALIARLHSQQAMYSVFEWPFKKIDKFIDAIFNPDPSYSQTESAYADGINLKAVPNAEITIDEQLTIISIAPNSIGQTALYAMQSSVNFINRAVGFTVDGFASLANFFTSAGPHYEEAITNFAANKMVGLKKVDDNIFEQTNGFLTRQEKPHNSVVPSKENSVSQNWDKASPSKSVTSFSLAAADISSKAEISVQVNHKSTSAAL